MITVESLSQLLTLPHQAGVTDVVYVRGSDAYYRHLNPGEAEVNGTTVIQAADGGVWSKRVEATGGGEGDVAGPESAVDERIAVFDGITGKAIKDGGKTLAELAAADHYHVMGEVTGLAEALAAVEAGEETPSFSNDFTENHTGIASSSSGTITDDFANSQIVVGNGTTGGSTRGVTITGLTQATGVEYVLVLFVTATPVKPWTLITKSSGGRLLYTISSAGYHTIRWTAVLAENAASPGLYPTGAEPSQSLTIGLVSAYTAPGVVLRSASGTTSDADLVRGQTTTVAIGRNLRPDATAGVQSFTTGSVNIAPNGLCGSTGVAVGPYAVTATGASGTGGLYGVGTSGGGENVAVGDYAMAASWRNTTIGSHALVLPVSSAAYGFYTFCGLPHSISMGRLGSLPHNMSTDYNAAAGNAFSAEPVDVYFGGGSCSRMANPWNVDDRSLCTDDRGAQTPIRRVQFHGPDAFDAMTGGSTTASSAVADTTARDAIPVTSRWPGMLVYVTDVKKTFMLNADFDATTIKRVKSFSRSGTTLTVTYHEKHGLAANDYVTLWGMNTGYSGTYQVTTVPDSAAGVNAVQITVEHGTSGTVAETTTTSGLGIKATIGDNTLWADLSVVGTGGTQWGRTTTQRSRTSNVAKLKLNAAHNYSVGNTVTISGMGDATFDAVEAVITDVTPLGGETYMVSYANTGIDVTVTADTGGTVTPHDVRSLNQPGRDLILSGGRGTGSGAAGLLSLKTAPVGSSSNGNVKNTLVEAGRFDALVDASNNKTRFLLLDTATGTLRRVEFGAADSGGTGYRMLRTAN